MTIESVLSQVFKNPLVVGRLGSVPRLLVQIGSGVQVSDIFHILSCVVVCAVVRYIWQIAQRV